MVQTWRDRVAELLPPRRLQLSGLWSVSVRHVAGNQELSEASGERVEQRHLGLLVQLRPLKETHNLKRVRPDSSRLHRHCGEITPDGAAETCSGALMEQVGIRLETFAISSGSGSGQCLQRTFYYACVSVSNYCKRSIFCKTSDCPVSSWTRK